MFFILMRFLASTESRSDVPCYNSTENDNLIWRHDVWKEMAKYVFEKSNNTTIKPISLKINENVEKL